jgi:L-gulonate 5-dehydrogenase
MSGELVEVRANRPDLVPGCKVAVNPTVGCGHCYPCRLGRPNCCVEVKCIGAHVDGGMCEYLAVPAAQVHRLPDDLDLQTAACIEPLSIGLQGCRRGRVAQGETVAIIGAGTIGLCALQMAKALGARVAIGDRIARRLELARRFGADLVVNVAGDDFEQQVAAWSGDEGANVVIEAVGLPETICQSLELVSAAGRVVLLGVLDEEVPLPAFTFVKKEMDFLGSRMNANLFPQVIEMLRAGRVDPRPLITHTFPLTAAEAAFRLASARPDEAVKVLLLP